MISRNVVAAVCAATIIATPVTAGAHSKSSSANIPGGGTVTSNVWIQNFASRNNCGNWNTSTTVNRTPAWVKNTASFNAWGVGASLKGVGVNANGSNASMSVTNNRGQRGAYLNGNICGNWATAYISASSSGVAMVNGNMTSAIASV